MQKYAIESLFVKPITEWQRILELWSYNKMTHDNQIEEHKKEQMREDIRIAQKQLRDGLGIPHEVASKRIIERLSEASGISSDNIAPTRKPRKNWGDQLEEVNSN